MAEYAGETRWTRKHQAIVEAATELFLSKGYLGTSMDEIAASAAVSKQTVYKHFSDKDQLFSEIVLATTGQVEERMQRVASSLEESSDLRGDLGKLARTLLAALMEPKFLRLRRLVVATADHFPEIGLAWYEAGFEKGLAPLAERFKSLSDQGFLATDDHVLAVHHFVGMLLWIPVNKAMFSGDHQSSTAELERYADAAVKAFLAAYSIQSVSLETSLAGRSSEPGAQRRTMRS